MKELSIFIDESGDFGQFSKRSPFYIISFVFHNQANSIKKQVEKLNDSLAELGLFEHTVHTAPLIRKENVYKKFEINKRFKIFTKLFNFARGVNITYESINIDKKYCTGQEAISQRITKCLQDMIRANLDYFRNFENIIIYYDDGQPRLADIIKNVFNSFFGDSFEYRAVSPSEYKLFQTADLFCTLELLKTKHKNDKKMTKSEKLFFGSYGKLRKNYLKFLETIKLNSVSKKKVLNKI